MPGNISSDATIAHAIQDEQNARNPQAATDSQAQREGRAAANGIGQVVGGDLGRGISVLGGALGGIHIGGKKNVKQITLDDGMAAQIALGESDAGPVALVVTANQTSVAIDKNHDGRFETIVTEADGKLTVGNLDTRRTVQIDNPTLAAALAKYELGHLPKKIENEFNGLATTAALADSLVPPPPAAPAPAAAPHGKKPGRSH